MVPALAAVARDLPPMVVLRSPRGFGKTSTVAQWLRGGHLDDRPAVWVSLSAPCSGEQMWAAVHSALVLAGLAAPTAAPGPEAVRAALLGLRHRLVIVLDGLHNVPDESVDSPLVELVHHAPLLHLVVITRSRRALEDIGPMFVDAVVVTDRDLVFAGEQTQLLAARVGLELSLEEARELTGTLAGWPALTRAVLLDSYRDADGTLHIVHTAVARFARIVLRDAENRHWRSLMTALAVPASFDQADYRALIDSKGTIGLVEQLRQTPFVVEQDGRWSVVAAVREALRDVLRTEDPARFRLLSETVAQRRRAEYRAVEALEHAVDAEAWPLVLTLLEENWAELLSVNREALRGAVGALPTEIVDSSARLTVARDFALDTHLVEHAERAIRTGMLVPDADLRVRPLTMTERLMLRSEGPLPATSGLLLREDGTPRALPEPSDVARAVPEHLVQWALSMLYENDAIGAAYGFALACRHAVDVGDVTVAREAASGAALTLALLGHLDHAEGWLARAETLADRPSVLEEVAVPFARGVLAALRLMPEATGRLPSRAAVSSGLVPLVVLARLANVQRSAYLGRAVRAIVDPPIHGLDGADADRRIVAAMRTAVLVDLALAAGDHDESAALLARATQTGPVLRVAFARHDFYVGAQREVVRRTEDAVDYAGSRPRAGLELLLLRACALWRLDQRTAALDTLSDAVAISRDSGVLLPFCSVPREDLLDIAGDTGYVRDFLDGPALAGTRCYFPPPLHVGELSAAELRVLGALVGEHSLVQIGRLLFVSESTVKTHVRRIYRKLGVSSRAAAVERARELSLLAEQPAAGSLRPGPRRSQ